MPLRYPSRDFKSFERGVRHFESMSTDNSWDDQRQREVLPTCLRSYALDEYNNLPNHYFQQVQAQPAPTTVGVLNALNNRIGNFPNARSAQTEFKSLQKMESESFQEFSRRVRKLGKQRMPTLTSLDDRKRTKTPSYTDYWTEKSDIHS